MDEHLLALVVDRLERDELDRQIEDLILAACDGPEAVDALLRGTATVTQTAAALRQGVPEPAGAYLASVQISGFRGIGPPSRLDVEPGPGLTIVIGRNGSGKSSFAEGLEILVTRECSRWLGRTRIWSENWQNLQEPGRTELAAEFCVDGVPGRTRLRATWAKGASLEDLSLEVVDAQGEVMEDDALGWEAAIARYRPFLSYNELGAMFDKPSTMYDAMAGLLGLEDVDAVQATLREARLQRERAMRDVRQEQQQLSAIIDASTDPRARAIEPEFRANQPDLDAVEMAVEGLAEGDGANDLRALREIAALRGPGEAVIGHTFEKLDQTRNELSRLAGSDSARDSRLAGLLLI